MKRAYERRLRELERTVEADEARRALEDRVAAEHFAAVWARTSAFVARDYRARHGHDELRAGADPVAGCAECIADPPLNLEEISSKIRAASASGSPAEAIMARALERAYRSELEGPI